MGCLGASWLGVEAARSLAGFVRAFVATGIRAKCLNPHWCHQLVKTSVTKISSSSRFVECESRPVRDTLDITLNCNCLASMIDEVRSLVGVRCRRSAGTSLFWIGGFRVLTVGRPIHLKQSCLHRLRSAAHLVYGVGREEKVPFAGNHTRCQRHRSAATGLALTSAAPFNKADIWNS